MSWQRINLADAEFAIPTEPPVTCGLIYRAKRHAISGPPESAKTLTALIFGLEHMRAGRGSFAIIDFEMGEHATRLLLEDLGATSDEIASVYYVFPEGPPDEADIEAMLTAGVTLAVVDAAAGAYDASGLDDNKRADVERFARLWITPLWKRGATTVTLDHVVKNSDNRGRYAIGSERKLGGVDVHLGLEAKTQLHRGGSGIVRITVHKDRPGHLRGNVPELQLHSDPATHQISWTLAPHTAPTGSADGWRPTLLMDRVLEHFSRDPEPISRSALANAVRGKREYVLQAIDFLIADQKLVEDGRKVVPKVVPPVERGNGNASRVPSREERTENVPRNGNEWQGDDDIPF